jgi:type VI secretion system protein ImpC
MYEEEYGQFGGEPYGCLVSDYYFDHSPPDVELLGEISKVCAASHVPFIAGAAPTVMQMDSWQELSNPRDLTKIFQTDDYASWRALRDRKTHATSVRHAAPGAVPYGPKTDRSTSSL